jgi:hypothetical protein
MITLNPEQILELIMFGKVELTDELLEQFAAYYGAVVIDEDDE